MKLEDNLKLQRCPYCGIANPNISKDHQFETESAYQNRRWWYIYVCQTCGSVIIASSNIHDNISCEIYPKITDVNESIPEKSRAFLDQARDTLYAPAGSIMLSASSIDAMLKAKGYKSGSLFSRIDQAAKNHLITDGMKEWAHQIRLEANDQRHADENAPLPSHDDAKRILDFAMALAEFLYVLPARVKQGIDNSKT